MRALRSCGLLVMVAVAGCAPHAQHEPGVGGVVLIVLDTLRADRLGVYGAERDASPSLDAFAARAVVFEQAISFAPWTLPSMIALLAARVPSRAVYAEGELTSSLVEVLRESGVRTAAFTEGGFVSAAFGLDRGFDEWSEHAGKVIRAGGGGGRDQAAGGITETFPAAIAWLRERGDERFFLLVHTYEPHTPYRRRFFTAGLEPGALGARTFEGAVQERVRAGRVPVGERERAYVKALYDGGVRVADGYVGLLLHALADAGLAETTAVIVTSDHGEDLGEREPRHLGDHGHSLYDELLRVPLLVFDPRRDHAGRRVAAQVRTLDVLPTALDLLGVEAPEGLAGSSLVPMMRGEEGASRIAFSRVTRKGPPRAAVRDGAWKRVRRLEGGGAGRFFDLRSDPEEREPSQPSAGEASRLDALLDDFLQRLESRGPLDFAITRESVPAELHERLRALGYLGEAGAAPTASPAP